MKQLALPACVWGIVIALASPCVAPARQDDLPVQTTPDEHYAAGMEHLRANRTREALGEFRQALRIDRDHLLSLVQIADVLSSTGRFFQAYGILRHGEKIAPQSPDVHLLLGRCLFFMKKFKEAQTEFHRALELNEELSEPHFALAVIEADQGRLAEAQRHIETYLETVQGEETIRALKILGRIALQMKDYDLAITANRKLLKMEAEGTHADVQMQIASALLAADRYAEAEQAYRKVLEKDSANQPALNGLFSASFLRGAYEQAIEAMKQLAQLQPTSCEPLINIVRSYLRLGQTEAARHFAESCLALVPDHSFAHYLLGRVLFSEGNLEAANTQLRKALEFNAGSVDTLYWLATVEMRLGGLDSALHRLEQAVSLDPEHSGVRQTLAQVYARKKRPAEAKEQLAEFHRIESRKAWNRRLDENETGAMPVGVPSAPIDTGQTGDWISLGKYLIQENKPRDALQILREAREKAPKDPEVLRLLAVAHTEIGEVDRALEIYAELEKQDPTALVFLERGKIYFKLEETKLALADFRRAITEQLTDSQAAEARLLVASLLNKQKRYGEAEAELRKALLLDPESPALHSMLGWILLRLEKPAEAAVEIRRALERAPDDASARLVLAQALIEQKQYIKAEKQIALASETQPESGRILLAWGRLAAAQRLRKAAIAYLTRAGELDPSQVESFYLLGLQFLAVGEPSRAAIAFEKATILDAAHAPSWLQLGQLYLNANRPQAAAGYFRKAVKAEPDNADGHYQLALAQSQTGNVAAAIQAARQAEALGHPSAQELLQSLAGTVP